MGRRYNRKQNSNQDHSRREVLPVRKGCLIVCLLACLLLSSCRQMPAREMTCTVLLEDNSELHFKRQIYEVPRGSDLMVTIGVPLGKRIASINEGAASVSPRVRVTGSYAEYEVTLPHILYPAVLRFSLTEDRSTHYTMADGTTLTVTEENSRLRINTLPYTEACRKEGCIPIGWTNDVGEMTGFGSRYTPGPEGMTVLQPRWVACTP